MSKDPTSSTSTKSEAERRTTLTDAGTVELDEADLDGVVGGQKSKTEGTGTDTTGTSKP